jgi:hypothetical protein
MFSLRCEGTGKLQVKYDLELDENATPIVHPPRKVPVAIKERLRNELERLTKMDIIKPVSTPTPWVSSLVIVVKPGKLRICIDQKHLNQNIKRSHYPLQTIRASGANDSVQTSIERCQVRAFVI